jgi:acetyl-CoA carboxylase biotin carboxyl carrier protein
MIKKKALPKKPSDAPPERRGAFGDLDFDAVRELARIASEFDLAEIETDPTGHIRVARRMERGGASSAGGVAAAPAGPSSPPPLTLMAPASEAADDRTAAITSPFVGTFYRSPSPEAAAFVEVGQTIRKGQVVCIVEAMKLMNEIESDLEGKLVTVLVKNGEHVEYGQPLFRVEKPS